jgi:hypothetical protein
MTAHKGTRGLLGWVATAAGTGAIVTTSVFLSGESNDLTQRRFDRLRGLNDAGWILAAGGATLVIVSYVFDGRPAARRTAAVGVGPGALVLAGCF